LSLVQTELRMDEEIDIAKGARISRPRCRMQLAACNVQRSSARASAPGISCLVPCCTDIMHCIPCATCHVVRCMPCCMLHAMLYVVCPVVWCAMLSAMRDVECWVAGQGTRRCADRACCGDFGTRRCIASGCKPHALHPNAPILPVLSILCIHRPKGEYV
jgi:hypothetical protein